MTSFLILGTLHISINAFQTKFQTILYLKWSEGNIDGANIATETSEASQKSSEEGKATSKHLQPLLSVFVLLEECNALMARYTQCIRQPSLALCKIMRINR